MLIQRLTPPQHLPPQIQAGWRPAAEWQTEVGAEMIRPLPKKQNPKATTSTKAETTEECPGEPTQNGSGKEKKEKSAKNNTDTDTENGPTEVRA